MKITWFGQACFLIESDGTAGSADRLAIITDPYDPKIGLTLPDNLCADVVTVSHQHMDHNNISAIGGNPTVISTSLPIGTKPVEIKDVTIVGIDSFHDNEGGKKRGKNIIFKFAISDENNDRIVFAHLGDLGHVLNDDQLRQLVGTGNIDILMIPVGGTYTIDAAVAVKVVHQIQPKIIIPMHYGIQGLGFPLDPVGMFTEKLAKPIKTEDILKISKTSLDAMEKEAEVVVLRPMGH